MRVRLRVLQPRDLGEDCGPAPRCSRCDIELHSMSQAIDCDYCDPLCPIWGTHGHLWNGDEESSRAAFHAAKEQEK